MDNSDSDSEEEENNSVEFQHSFQLVFTSLRNFKFNEPVYFDKVKLVHNGIGYEFQTEMMPAGSIGESGEKVKDHMAVFHTYSKGHFQTLKNVGTVEFLKGFKFVEAGTMLLTNWTKRSESSNSLRSAVKTR